MPFMSFVVHLPAQWVCTGQVTSRDLATTVRLLLLSPLLEEWVLRAGLQEWLIRHSARTTRGAGAHAGIRACLGPVACSAAVFGLMHLLSGWRAVVLVLPPGLAMALLYQSSRDWRQCALLHCGLNALALVGCAL